MAGFRMVEAASSRAQKALSDHLNFSVPTSGGPRTREPCPVKKGWSGLQESVCFISQPDVGRRPRRQRFNPICRIRTGERRRKRSRTRIAERRKLRNPGVDPGRATASGSSLADATRIPPHERLPGASSETTSWQCSERCPSTAKRPAGGTGQEKALPSEVGGKFGSGVVK